jgi:hypothetical protein
VDSEVFANEVTSNTASSEDLLFPTFENNSLQYLQNNSISDGYLNNSVFNKTSFGFNKTSKKKKCFVCGSKVHLIMDCDFHDKRMGVSVAYNRPRSKWTNAYSKPSLIHSVSADWFVPADRSVSASRYFTTDRNTYTTRPLSGYNHTYFRNGYWPKCYDPMFLGRAHWDFAVKSSADCSWKINRPYVYRDSRNNGGSNSSTWLHNKDPQGRLKSFKT